MKAKTFKVRKVDYLKDKQAYLVKFEYYGENGESIGIEGCDVTVRLKADHNLEEKARSVYREITKLINGFGSQKELENYIKGKEIPLDGIKKEDK